MTEEEINAAVAELCGLANRWVLMKRGLYYRSNAHGYTNHIELAWVVDEAIASKHAYQHGDEPVTKHPAPILNYCGDLNAMREALMTLTPADQDRYAAVLSQIVDGRRIDLGATRIETTTKVLFASARQQAKAFLIIRGKWMDT